MRSYETLGLSESDVIGCTLMPSSPMKKGNSLVPATHRGRATHRNTLLRAGDGWHLVGEAVAKKDSLVDVIFLETVAREVFTTALGGDDGGDALVFQWRSPLRRMASMGKLMKRISGV